MLRLTPYSPHDWILRFEDDVPISRAHLVLRHQNHRWQTRRLWQDPQNDPQALAALALALIPLGISGPPRPFRAILALGRQRLERVARLSLRQIFRWIRRDLRWHGLLPDPAKNVMASGPFQAPNIGSPHDCTRAQIL